MANWNKISDCCRSVCWLGQQYIKICIILPDITWCRFVGSTTPRCAPPSRRSSRCCVRTCTLPSRRCPSSTVKRTSRPRPKTLIWTWKTWRASHWIRHLTPRGSSVWTGERPPPWAWEAVMRSTTSRSHTWTGERPTDEYWPYHGRAPPNKLQILHKNIDAIDLNIFLFFCCHFI